MTTAVKLVEKKLFNFEIASLDAKLLNDKKSKNRVLNVLSELEQYKLPLYILVKDEHERELARSFISSNNINAEVIMIDSPYDKTKKLTSIVAGKADLKLDKKVDTGKKIFHLGYRSSNFIDTFDPPKGVVCRKFYKVVWGSQCPYDCSYCFLQLTYRIFPYVQQYLNLEDLFKEMEKLNQKVDKPVILNSGELSDSLALDWVTGIASEVIEKASGLENIKLLLLSKGKRVEHLPEVSEGKAIVSVSLNTPTNAKLFEEGTAGPNDRIAALEELKKKGYEVRCRIDPIITHSDNWEKEYRELIDHLFATVSPKIITLGQPRFYSTLINIIKKRQPEVGDYFDSDAVSSVGKRKRPDFEHRFKVYEKIVSIIKSYDDCNIALCKEDPEIVKRLNVDQKLCNCI